MAAVGLAVDRAVKLDAYDRATIHVRAGRVARTWAGEVTSHSPAKRP